MLWILVKNGEYLLKKGVLCVYIQGKYLLGGLHDISECLAIRNEVFGGEQQFLVAASENLEYKDAIFVLAYETNEVGEEVPVATGRLIFLEDRFKIGRIAVKKECRGKHYGDFVVRMLLDKAFSMGAKEVFVGAQSHAISFYEKIGFERQEEEYWEDNIYHLMMKIKGYCSHSS